MTIYHDPGPNGPSGEGETTLFFIFMSYFFSVITLLYNRKSQQRLETDERIDVAVDETTLPTEMILEKRDKERYDDWDNNHYSYVPSVEYRLKFIKYASLGMITKGNYENIEENGVVFRIFYYMSGIHWLKVGLFLGVWVLIWLFLICLGLMSTGYIRMAPNIEYLYKCPYPSNCETATPFWNTENDTISNIAYIMINSNTAYVNNTIEVCTTMKYDLCDGRLLNGGIFYRDWHLSDNEAGALCVWFSLSGICAVLYLMVQSLNLLIKGSIAKWIKRAVSLNGYLSMLMGMFITVMVQSSSITTSVLTPLVAIGLIPLKDMYPLTLGANVGTTITGILSASVVTSNPAAAWQVALTHFFFNIFGIVLWYPLKRTRKVPLRMAVYLGNQTVKYKLFPLVYTGTVFFVIPAVIYGISLSV